MQLRAYQQDAIKAAYEYLAARNDHVLLVLPTGSGKSIVIAQVCKDAVLRWHGRVLVLAHRKELLEQNADKIMRLAPELKVGIYSAGLKRREHNRPVVVAGIQSVFTRGCEMGRFDLCLVDEVHRIPPDGDGMYRTLLTDMHAVNPTLRVIGLTATPYRMGTGYLYGDGALFPDVCYEVGVKPLMVQGFLARIKSKTGSAESVADTSGVHVRGGEFIEAELEACMSDAAIVKAAVAETIAYADRQGRKKCLIFACGIAHAEMISREFSEQGHACYAVHSQISDESRNDIVQAFREGSIRFLVNPMILTEGFDDPAIDMIALMRATKSPGLFYQMTGRGFRPHPGKEDCCIAEGELVLTETGLVPIESVTREMRVWDGVEWVSHGGTICRGEQEVITYAGLTATADHRVWTEEGWKAFGQCRDGQVSIAKTGDGRQAIKQSDDYYAGSAVRVDQEARGNTIWAEATTDVRSVPEMSSWCMEGSRQPGLGNRWMSKLWESTIGTEVASCARDFRQVALYQPERLSVYRLRRPWNQVLVPVANGNGCMGATKPWSATTHADRQNQQRWPLRGWQPAICNSARERAKQPQDTQSARVWDLINCGPRHRFTASGLLVSNCVLDFGENVLRHGPVDKISPKKNGGDGSGEAPVKKCPECKELVPTAMLICPSCGFEWPDPKLARHNAKADGGPIISEPPKPPEWRPVERVAYYEHKKKGADDDAPKTMRVEYILGWRERVSEWVCIEHPMGSFPERRAASWWAARCRLHDMPKIAREAVELAQRGVLWEPSEILVENPKDKDGFPRIIDYKLVKEQAMPADFKPAADDDLPF